MAGEEVKMSEEMLSQGVVKISLEETKEKQIATEESDHSEISLTSGSREILCEGKTKIVYLPTGDDTSNVVLIENKDRITAFNSKRADIIEGKAELSNDLNAMVFELLHKAGLKTSFIKKVDDKFYLAKRCDMIPIEWVARRIATGSFLKRNPGVKEGYKFKPPKIETFLKDDENDDPELSMEQILQRKLKIGNVHKKITSYDYDLMSRQTSLIFEILEKAWADLDCVLVDMKIEFGVEHGSGDIILSDVIDNDSWRLWPQGDKKLMKDKQVYRDAETIDEGALKKVKANFQWVVDRLGELDITCHGQVVIIMGSNSDVQFSKKVAERCERFNLNVALRICSAHKATSDVLNMVAEYDALPGPVVYIAVAGRSNGLGPVIAGNSCRPVINCPPLKDTDKSMDIWSSLNVPSNLGCCTVASPDGAASCAASILALTDFWTWSRLRFQQFVQWKTLALCDRDLVKSLKKMPLS